MRATARPEVLDVLIDRLLERRAAPDHWDGRLASSALSTATAVLALDITARNGHPDADRLAPLVAAGARHISFGPPLGPDPLAAVRLLGREVLPYFRS